ncbi:MAG: DUF4430 domain-containing protein [Candidatus Thermoplasmatota archaeon]
MRWTRPALAILLLVSLAAGGVALAAWSHAGPLSTAGTFAVEIVGPSGQLYQGNVTVADATALSALRAACKHAGLALETEEYPGMGAYVRAIGGHRASGASGWVYEVHRNGTWLSADRSAGSYPLHAGDALRWSWTEGGS